jgi:glutamate dehydrogenase
MSGDVFGNGMLRSEQTRLVAAFDHRDVFLDPDPDPAAGFAERQRLFSTPRSSWQDYDPAAISEGGGVFSRSAKSIALSRQARTALRLDVEDVTPAELIQAVLRAPVDLLYLGGIGTYVRAGTEDDRRLDDRANADLRVTAGSLRARVVGEGANLGFTQPARIEYARRGGRINMDAIDNAAGVDSSDHEVNLKILLSLAVDAGEITAEERNVLLGEHDDDVVAAVLSDTANQCDCLTHAVQPSADDLATFVGVLDELVEIGVVDPEVESLPDATELAARQRADAGLTRPELAVLLAGVKRKLRAEVLLSDLPDDAATRDALVGYFPPALAKRFDHLLDRHRLRRELVTSEIANDLVDRMGLTFVHRLGAEAGVGSADVARAYWYASRVVDAPALWARIDENTGTATATFDTDQVDGKQVLADLIESLARHELLIRHAPATLTERIAHERPVFLTLRQDLPRLDRPAQLRARSRLREQLMAGGLSSQVADEVATLTELDLVPDAALLARSTGRPAAEVAAAMLRISDRLGFDRVRDRVRTLPSVDGWSRSARQGLLDDLDELRRQAAKRALERHPESTGEEAADRFLDERSHRLHELGGMLRRLESDREAGLDALTVVVRAVRHAAT